MFRGLPESSEDVFIVCPSDKLLLETGLFFSGSKICLWLPIESVARKCLSKINARFAEQVRRQFSASFWSNFMSVRNCHLHTNYFFARTSSY